LSTYQPADSAWFSRCRFGIAVHWTAQSQPVSGSAEPFPEAVTHFDVDRFTRLVAAAGADYLLFTVAHALQFIPAPCAMVDGILPGRTTRRDLLGDLADACRARGLKLLLYYNHSCNGGEDPAWEQAVGYHDADKAAFAERLCGIVAELSARYGPSVAAWWFDSPYSLDPSGPNNSVSTDLRGFRFPWEQFTTAAKAGHPGRLVTYNPGVQPHAWHFLYTRHQDYLAGEANTLINPPAKQFAPNGLQNHRWVCLDNPQWVHARAGMPLVPPRYGREELRDYLRAARAATTPVTFNVDVDQGGQVLDATVKLLASL
jgi:hypothetical protein